MWLHIYCVSAVLFNLCSWGGCFGAGQVATLTPPLSAAAFLLSFLLVDAWGSTSQLKAAKTVVGGFFVLASAKLFSAGILLHLVTPYASMCGFHPSAWVWGVALNVFVGVPATFARARHYLGPNFRKACALTLVLLLARGVQWWRVDSKACAGNDVPWYSELLPLRGQSRRAAEAAWQYSGVETSSVFVTASDGTRLALDLHVPVGWANLSAEGVPTFFHATRYTRAFKVKWPFSLKNEVWNTRSGHYVKEFLPHGYALVSMDMRGTGASFGSRPVDFTPRELADLVEAARWVRAQPWSDGRLVTGGISYDGMAGLQLAARLGRKGGVVALAHIFSPLGMKEMVAPGGVQAISFVQAYGRYTSNIERGQRPVGFPMPLMAWVLLHHVLGEPWPVNGDEEALQMALKEHNSNWDMETFINEHSLFLDDPVFKDPEQGKAVGVARVVDMMQNEDILRKLKQGGTAIRAYEGYFDAGMLRGTVKLQHVLPTSQVSSVVGPWNHGLRSVCSPFNARRDSFEPCFPLWRDMRLFFDEQLDGAEEMQAGGAHFFTMGAEQWRHAAQWPPLTAPHRFGLCSDRTLSAVPCKAGEVEFVPPHDTSSGKASRWNLINALFHMPSVYHRLPVDRMLTFTSPPLQNALTFTGSAQLQLCLELVDGVDAAVFAYLLDVSPAVGLSWAKRATPPQPHYITEGVVRLGHRCVPEEKGAAQCEQTLFRKHFRPLSGREEVRWQFEPVSYHVKAGHRLQIALAGYDQDNFRVDATAIPGLARAWRVHAQVEGCLSRLTLPVEPASR